MRTYDSMRETLAVFSRAGQIKKYRTYKKEISAGPPTETKDGPTTDDKE